MPASSSHWAARVKIGDCGRPHICGESGNTPRSLLSIASWSTSARQRDLRPLIAPRSKSSATDSLYTDHRYDPCRVRDLPIPTSSISPSSEFLSPSDTSSSSTTLIFCVALSFAKLFSSSCALRRSAVSCVRARVDEDKRGPVRRYVLCRAGELLENDKRRLNNVSVRHARCKQMEQRPGSLDDASQMNEREGMGDERTFWQDRHGIPPLG